MSPRGIPTGFVLLRRIALLALCCWVLAAPASRAQDSGGLPGFLQHLFGFPPKPQASPQSTAPSKARTHKPRKKGQDFVSTTATRAPGSPGGAPVQPTFFVSVLGDSLAILAAQGLSDAFADKPEISITNLARDLSGLTRDDYYDWPKSARDLVAGNPKIDVVVIMIGINDLQPLKDGARHARPAQRQMARSVCTASRKLRRRRFMMLIFLFSGSACRRCAMNVSIAKRAR